MKATLFYIKTIFLLFFLSYIFPLLFLLSINQTVKENSTSIDPIDSIFVLQEWKSQYELKPYISILEETTDSFSIEDIQQPLLQGKFQPVPQLSDKIKSQQVYWGKIQLKNELPQADQYTEWVLDFSTTWTTLDIFVPRIDGTFEKQPNGFFLPNHHKKFVPTINGLLSKILLLPEQTTTVYFRGKSEIKTIPPLLRLHLQHSDAYYQDLQYRKIPNALFLGFIMMMFSYNMMLYFFEKDKSFIFYSIYLFNISIYFSFSAADLGDWLGHLLHPNHPEYVHFGKLALYPAIMGYLAFINSFLDLKTLLPRWSRIFKFLIGLGLPLFTIDLVLLLSSNFSYVKADKVTVLYILLSINTCFLLIFPLIKTRNKNGYFIVAGIFLVGLGVFLTVIARLTTSGFSIFYLKLGTLLEIITFSLGLAYRQREKEKAKQLANFKLEKTQLIQTQKNKETEQLKALNTFKNQFYANITHEFRTPLTVIQGIAGQIGGKKYAQQTHLIQRNSHKLLQLVNQMLDLSKLESGKMTIQKTQADLNEYLPYILESFHSLAQQKNIQISFEPEQPQLIVDYDAEKLRKICTNLLSNAIKFTPEGKTILLTTKVIQKEAQAFWQLQLTDEGVGIAPSELPYIFDRFYQADTSPTRMGEGTGIGLALVKELVHLLKGEIQVNSKPQQGTTFSLTFPLTNDAPLVDFSSENNTVNRDLISETPIPLSPKLNMNPDLPLALLIEDNEDVLHYLVKCLQDQYQIITALNGVEGMTQAIENIPDIIISDVMMPQADGYEVCATLKKDERTSHIPIILLTAKADLDSKIEGLTSGADAYLPKPFDEKELMIRLAKLVELRKKLQDRYQIISQEQVEIPRFSIEDAFLQKVKNAIESQMSKEDFSVEILAQQLYISRTQLFRKIKALTGKSPSLFIRSVRLHQAKKLLETTALSVSQVAYEVGFKDLSHFSSSFSQEFGMMPSVVRELDT